MENAGNQFRRQYQPHRNNHRLGGLVLILIGILFLLNRIPETSHWFPRWFFSWPMFLIAMGIFTGVKNRFRNVAWFILILVGGYFLVEQQGMISLDIRPYLLPAGLIILGVFIIIKRSRPAPNRFGRSRPFPQQAAAATEEPLTGELFEVNSVFGNIERKIFSKDLKGGNIACFCGGAQVNLSHADFEGTIAIDLSITLGGTEIIVPSNWELKNEVSAIFGGVEDRRTVAMPATTPRKTLILKGNVIFGGIEIKSY